MKTFRIVIISFLFLIALGQFMPFTFMVDPREPEYLLYTSLWNIAAGFLLYPSYLAARLLGVNDIAWASLILDMFWFGLLSSQIYLGFPLFSSLSRTLSSAFQEQDG